MILGLIAVVLLTLILCFACRTSKISVYLFKIVLGISCGLAILIIYFFSLGTQMHIALNWQLRPWSMQVLPRLAVAVLFAALVLAASQLPFLFSKAFSKVLRNKVILIETCVYVAFCLIGGLLCYNSTVNVPKSLKPGNEVVMSIDSFEKKHNRFPRNLGELDLNMNQLTENEWEYLGQYFHYLNFGEAYSLVFITNEYGEEATYESDAHEWIAGELQYNIEPVDTIPE